MATKSSTKCSFLHILRVENFVEKDMFISCLMEFHEKMWKMVYIKALTTQISPKSGTPNNVTCMLNG
jgi:hypothetical protein